MAQRVKAMIPLPPYAVLDQYAEVKYAPNTRLKDHKGREIGTVTGVRAVDGGIEIEVELDRSTPAYRKFEIQEEK